MTRALCITRVAVDGFRNLRGIDLEPDRHVNVFIGANGQGKTSLLEAVDYVATLRSFRGVTRAQLVAHDRERADISLRVEGGALPHQFVLHLSREGREVLLDGKRPERAITYYGGAACVVFQPEDLDLVRGAPAIRRRLLDRVLVRMVDGYGETLRSYARALKARNTLLRLAVADPRALVAYEPIISALGSTIVRERQQVTGELADEARDALSAFARVEARIGLTYRTRASRDSNEYRAALSKAQSTDLSRGVTTVGPHADDLQITWNGRAARFVASQGQTRALALALRLAELRVLHARTGLLPILLLDDVSSELDRSRTQALLGHVEGLGAQLWITTTDPGVVDLLPRGAVHLIENGRIARE